MGGVKVALKIDRSDLTALKKVGATIDLYFDASHTLKDKQPHFEVHVLITEPARAQLAKDA
jgi:hypothetical protein